MKNYILNIKFLLFSLLLFVSAFLIDKKQLENTDYEIDIEKFQNVLHKKEAQLEIILDTLEKNIELNNFQFYNSGKNIFFVQDFSELVNETMEILIYHNDTLKYWTSNFFDIEKTFSKSILNGKIANLNNAWYELKTIDLNEFIIVGLLKIKNQYPYENEFVVNDFSAGFDLPSSLKISKIPLSFSFEIESKDNEYIFSIVPSNTIITTKEHSTIASVLYLLSFLILIYHLHLAFQKNLSEKQKPLRILIIFLVIIFVRIIMIKFKIPVYVYSLDIFDPSHYAKSFLFASLGDFLINSVILIFFHYYLYKILILLSKIKKIKSDKTNMYFFIILMFINTLYFCLIQNLLQSLIEDSNISFEIFNILNLDLFSIIAIITYTALLTAFVYVNDRIIMFFRNLVNLKIIIFLILFILILTFLLNIVFPEIIGIVSIIYLILIYFSTIFIRIRQKSFKLYSYILITFFSALFVGYFLTDFITKKEKEEGKLLVTQLVNERDILAELLLSDIEKEIENDETIKTYIQKPDDERTDDKIETYIKQKYFNGYWNKYYLDILIFSDIDNISEEHSLQKADNSVNKILKTNGIALENSNSFFIDNKDGSISYISKHQYLISDSTHIALMYINLDSKLLSNEIGYPELLIDQTIKTSVFQDYSYQKYKKDRLISKSGNNFFDFNYADFVNIDSQFIFISQGKYRHLIYKYDNENFIILTNERIYLFDFLITFAYLFVFFNLVLVTLLLIKFLPNFSSNFTIDFKNKLILSMIFILLISFILIGGTTVYYNVIQYKNKHNENIQDKIQSISIKLEQEIGNYDSINFVFNGKELNYLDYKLRDISEVFFSDINLYNLEGYLIATSRPEIFNKYLIGTRIDQKAFYQLVINNKSDFINNEKIGKLEFTSAYITLKNANNQNIAYINVPYFIKPSILQEEISNLLVTIVNLYVMLFIVALVLAIILSEQLVSPLRMLKDKFQYLELGKEYEFIEYQGKDEIGDLVREYNAMVKKLEENVKLLAESERESAWREMAKQIAHEIKNPLTPMKLRIQHLLNSWEKKDENFDKKIKDVSEVLIEQIDTLSKIATEFSSFAKIPVPNEEQFNLINTIETTAQLYENTENIEIKTNLNNNTQADIIADKEQISRVFINLLKNAIQSIPEGVKGNINIDLFIKNQKITVSIEDNGTGISDETKNKLFQPSFTTKSSGMGLGLAIVKNIVNSAKGEIWFETKLGVGTKFYVEFPIVEAK